MNPSEWTYAIGTSLEVTENFIFNGIDFESIFTTSCLVSAQAVVPLFTFNDKDLLKIDEYDYENRLNCDEQTNVDIKDCLGAEFAVLFWDSKIIKDFDTFELSLTMPVMSDERMLGM